MAVQEHTVYIKFLCANYVKNNAIKLEYSNEYAKENLIICELGEPQLSADRRQQEKTEHFIYKEYFKMLVHIYFLYELQERSISKLKTTLFQIIN